MLKQLNRHFGLVLYLLCFSGGLATLWQGVSLGLFPAPIAGTDQLTMVQAAVGMYYGKLPPPDYLYSPSYTILLWLLVTLTHGNLFFIRLLQVAICALVPVIIYRFGRVIRLPRPAAKLSGLIWCFYGPATLLSIDLLREIPLCLCFILYAWLLTRGFLRRSKVDFLLAGMSMGLCILGRENFIPIAAAPAVLLLLPALRRHLRWSGIASYCGGILVMLLPIMCYNLFRSGNFAIVPGHVANIIGGYHGQEASRNVGQAVFSIVSGIPRQLHLFVRMYELDNSLSFYAHREMIPTLRIMFIPYNIILALAAAGLLTCCRNRGVLLCTVLALSYAGTMLYFELFYRYRIPIVAMLAVLAGAGLWSIVKAGSWKRALFPLSLVLLIAAFTWDNPNRLRRPGERYGVVHAMLVNRQFDQAENYIRRLDAEGIPTQPVKIRLLQALVKAGQTADAARLHLEYSKESSNTAKQQ